MLDARILLLGGQYDRDAFRDPPFRREALERDAEGAQYPDKFVVELEVLSDDPEYVCTTETWDRKRNILL
jgi:hypothetical protein